MPTIHIVSHTHWDREWYKSFQYFRTKLIYVIDDLLSILENDDNFKSFLLMVKPLSWMTIYSYARKGTPIKRINHQWTPGRRPWYIQPDEFAPDGESLIRNLQTGIREAVVSPEHDGRLSTRFLRPKRTTATHSTRL